MPNRYRIFARPIVTSPGISTVALIQRLEAYRHRLRLKRMARAETDPAGSFSIEEIGMLCELDALLDMPPDDFGGDVHADDFAPDAGNAASMRLRDRAAGWLIRRNDLYLQQVAHLKTEERLQIEQAIGRGRVSGIVSQHQMHERVAALHAEAPWMSPAATAVMETMTRETAQGPAPLRIPPVILLGAPGIGKTEWAQRVAQAFQVPSITLDVGAANGGVFALSGVERGFSNAAPGRVVRSILATHVVNPLVIIDELDRASERTQTSRGQQPGLAAVLMSLVEPSSARSWTCPFYQLPFDLSRVSWIMTANSLEGMPAPLIDRCRVIALPDPTPADLELAAARMIAQRTADADHADLLTTLVAEVLRQRRRAGRRTSLRQLSRIVARLEVAGSAPMLM
ncbi:AAA family ATPase [Paracoccus sp. NSM]|uniref:AAA family ATPase n=1 Tax=Paracoccus sp. NSM TaxID=3457784 RepID=UPI00403604B8